MKRHSVNPLETCRVCTKTARGVVILGDGAVVALCSDSCTAAFAHELRILAGLDAWLAAIPKEYQDGDPVHGHGGVLDQFRRGHWRPLLKDEPTGARDLAGDPQSPGDGTAREVRDAHPRAVQGGATCTKCREDAHPDFMASYRASPGLWALPCPGGGDHDWQAAADERSCELRGEVVELVVSHKFPWCRARLLHALAGADEQGVLMTVLEELLPDDDDAPLVIANALFENGWHPLEVMKPVTEIAAMATVTPIERELTAAALQTLLDAQVAEGDLEQSTGLDGRPQYRQTPQGKAKAEALIKGLMADRHG